SLASRGTTGGNSGTSGMGHILGELAGQVFVVADPDTNSLLVSTASKYQVQVKKIIAQLDRPIPQVLIKVLIAEVTHDRTNDFGMDFSILDTRASGKGTVAGSTLGNAASYVANGGLAVSIMETNFNATLHALATEGKLDVLSRPYILASDNQQASIMVGQQVPLITGTTAQPLGGTFSSIEYAQVGIILNVTPHINPDGLVILDVSPQVSQLTGVTVPTGNGGSAPIISSRSASSRVQIRNGNTIVIGGMMQDQKTVTVTKIPLLGDIPYFGSIFSRTQNDVTKTELLIFLTPHVAQEPDLLPGMSNDEMKNTELTPRAISPGAFQKQMDGMHRGESPTHPSTEPAVTPIANPPSTQPFHGVTISAPPASQ
ncbi:MAG TPA: secretin N-terminal domain-containing protein, partial [Tepidisphaeraceae bacterium]|nr:secretin N-terminal domain-containing protein [Tepidisphaeraceae bacterium]